jgi:hypothetical protein
MASAIENDVWCYLVDNPNLLTGQTCSSSTGLTPTDIYGNPIILPTAQTLTDVSVIIGDATNYLYSCIAAAPYPKIDICYPEIENQVCGDTLKILLDNGNKSLWVTCQDGQLGFYYISANTNTQNTIFNITQSTLDPISLKIDLFKLRVSDDGGMFYSEDCLSDILVNFVFNGSSLGALTSYIEVINDFIVKTNSDHPLYEAFWNSDGTCNFCNNTCGDKRIDFSGFMSTNISEIKTLESFDDLMISELIDVKNRKTLSSYPSLRAVYDRYMDATEYGLTNSNEFDYYKMDQFTSLVKTYWDDLIEQVVPSTTIWGNVKVYTNTLFDQQKFKYRSYTTLLCNSPLNFTTLPSPINGSDGQCKDIEIIVQNVQTTSGVTSYTSNKQTFNSVCISQMNWGSEFVGNVDIRDGSNNYINNDTFCNTCDKNIRWYNMVDRPDYMMESLVCYPESFGTTALTFTISSLIVNNIEYVSTTISSTTITSNNVNFVRAENNIVSGCTSGGITGWTYTNFVDFLNDTFINLGLTEYKAIISLKEKQGVSDECSKNGFYISYPKNDTFSIVMDSDSDWVGTIYNYNNLGLFVTDGLSYYYCSTAENIDYDCLKNIVNE